MPNEEAETLTKYCKKKDIQKLDLSVRQLKIKWLGMSRTYKHKIKGGDEDFFKYSA